jgi:hypothetical protein
MVRHPERSEGSAVPSSSGAKRLEDLLFSASQQQILLLAALAEDDGIADPSSLRSSG